MAKKLTKEQAARFLGDVRPDKVFLVFNGPTLKNVEELYNYFSQMSVEQFSYHRNNEKNDFYNWVLQVVGDIRLANEIIRSKTRETTMKNVGQRIAFLKQIIVQESSNS